MNYNGYLISNRKATNFLKWYLKNPLGSFHSSIIYHYLNQVQKNNLPVFRQKLLTLAHHQFDSKEVPNLNLYTDNVAFKTTIKYYLGVLKDEKLMPTQSATPMISSINRSSNNRCKSLLKKMLLLLPMAKKEISNKYNKSITKNKKLIASYNVSIDSWGRKESHWYTTKINKGVYKSNVEKYKKKRHLLKNIVRKQINKQKHCINILDTLKALSVHFSPAVYSDFYNHGYYDTKVGKSEYYYHVGKGLLTYHNGCVTADLYNPKCSKSSHNCMRHVFTKPNATLFVHAIYNTIAHLPYLNLRHIGHGDSFAGDLTKNHIFASKYNDNFLHERYIFTKHKNYTKNFSDQNIVQDFKNYHDFAKRLEPSYVQTK